MFGISFESVHTILKENINMRRIAASFVSRDHFFGECLAGSKMAVVPPSPYSLDLVPCDFYLFQELNMVLKESRFNNITKIKRKSREAFSEFQILHFTKCFERYCNRWAECIKFQSR
jgi:hypothetical protein